MFWLQTWCLSTHSFVSADNSGALNGSRVEWTLDIAANSSITLQAVFAVDSPLDAAATTIANNAVVNDQP